MKFANILKLAAFTAALSVASANAEDASPAASKLRDEIGAQVEKLVFKAPDNASEADKVKFAQQFDALKQFAKENLLPLCTDKVFVEEIEKQNAKKVTLAEIQKIDKEWTDAESELPIQKDCLNNTCAVEVKKIAAKLPALGEVFVMDNQGANVGQNALTSDYWQGDEPKWQNSFKGGKGGVDLGKRVLDKSTNVVDQKISLPIINEKGEVVGAICCGVKIELLK
jgi:hypothetical protein